MVAPATAVPLEANILLTRGRLLRVLGMAFALAVGIGTTMGGGILYTPGNIAALLPNTWLYMAVWVFGGVNALLGATVFSELGAMIPLSGGPYPFARRAIRNGSWITPRMLRFCCSSASTPTCWRLL
jgi:amino acid transporter